MIYGIKIPWKGGGSGKLAKGVNSLEYVINEHMAPEADSGDHKQLRVFNLLREGSINILHFISRISRFEDD